MKKCFQLINKHQSLIAQARLVYDERGADRPPQQSESGNNTDAAKYRALAKETGKTWQELLDWNKKFDFDQNGLDKFDKDNYKPEKLYAKLATKNEDIKKASGELKKNWNEAGKLFYEELAKLNKDSLIGMLSSTSYMEKYSNAYERLVAASKKFGRNNDSANACETAMWKLEETLGMPHPKGAENGAIKHFWTNSEITKQLFTSPMARPSIELDPRVLADQVMNHRGDTDYLNGITSNIEMLLNRYRRTFQTDLNQ